MSRIEFDTVSARPSTLIGRLSSALAAYRNEARRRWLIRTTEKAIAELTPQMRKDIGWPTRYDC